MRAAVGLEGPAWICGAAALVLLVLQCLVLQQGKAFAVTTTLMLALACMLWSRRAPSMGATSPSPRMPGEIHDLLALVDSLVDTLERGKDRLFNVDMFQLGVALERLGPEAQRYLEERGADRARLCYGLGWSDTETSLSGDRRRAYHHELLRFAAAVRGRPCGDPYRSGMSDGPILLAVVRDPALARTRRRCAALLVSVAVIWVVVSRSVAALQTRRSRLCNPWGDNPNCGFEIDFAAQLEMMRTTLPLIDLELLSIFSAALAPMLLLVAAHVSRTASWRSFAAALPECECKSSERLDRPLARARRRERVMRGLWRTLAWLASVFAFAVMIVAYDWNRCDFLLVERVILIELVTFAVVLMPTLIGKLEHRRELRRVQRRMARAPRSAALLSELFELRSELEHAVPARGELLEQLATTLAQADALGRLSEQDRDRVVARLRAGAARGPALDRGQQAALLLDVCACEAAIGARS